MAKISENARQVAILMGKYLDDLARRTGHPKLPTPRIDGLVVLTATSDVSGIAPTEGGSVFALDDFISTITNTKDRISRLPKAAPCFVQTPLTSVTWKPRLDKFFNASTGFFRPGMRRYGGYIAASDAPSFAHASGVYAEYDVEDDTAARATGLLRKWDFTRAETRFQTEQGRNEIVGRERNVIAWLNDRSPDCEAAVLQPRVDEPERGVGYWEVFEKRRHLKRLSEFVKTELARHTPDAREELVRQMLARATTLHDYDAAHLDLGQHSVWIESPSSVRLSHLMSARFPEARSLGVTRYQFLSSVKAPEDILGGDVSTKRKDVFLLGCLSHLLLFGKYPHCINGDPPEWHPGVDAEAQYEHLHAWMERALSWEIDSRFSDAGQMLDAFNHNSTRATSTVAVMTRLESCEGIRPFCSLSKPCQSTKSFGTTISVRFGLLGVVTRNCF